MNESSQPKQFALIGVAGFVAPRHLKAIRDTGHQLAAAVDPHDSVGVLDSYFPQSRFFTEIERFDRYLEKSRRDSSLQPIDYVSICSPNYLHDAHVRLALRIQAHALCEKPLVINPWNLDQLSELEREHDRRVYTVLQLRLHPSVVALKKKLESEAESTRHEVCLTYVTSRGTWYLASWKGSEEKSGGLAMNIGIHFFDVLLWLFGRVHRNHVHVAEARRMAGMLELENATVRWYLSVDPNDLPEETRNEHGHAYRSLTIDGDEFDFSGGFTDLHTDVYRQTLAGNGFGIDDARPSIELVYSIRTTRPTSGGETHPLVRGYR